MSYYPIDENNNRDATNDGVSGTHRKSNRYLGHTLSALMSFDRDLRDTLNKLNQNYQSIYGAMLPIIGHLPEVQNFPRMDTSASNALVSTRYGSTDSPAYRRISKVYLNTVYKDYNQGQIDEREFGNRLWKVKNSSAPLRSTQRLLEKWVSDYNNEVVERIRGNTSQDLRALEEVLSNVGFDGPWNEP